MTPVYGRMPQASGSPYQQPMYVQPTSQPQSQQQPDLSGLATALMKNQGIGAGASTGGGAGGGSAAGGAGGGGGSWMASAGPWAALAAVIIANESEAKKGGYRDEDKKDYALDLLDGKVFEQDMNQRWSKYGDKLDDSLGTNTGDTMRTMGELSTFDFSNAGKSFEDTLKKDPLVKGLLKLF